MAYNNGRFFPPEYYEICNSNSAKKTENWFCNRPLTPSMRKTDLHTKFLSSTDTNVSVTVDSNENITSRVDDMLDESTDLKNSGSNYSPQFSDTSNKSILSETSLDEVSSENMEQNFSNDCFDYNIANTNLNNHVESRSLPENAESSLINTNDTIYCCKGKRQRQKDFCFFCESLVQNFARHVIRNHSGEIEVQKIMSLQPSNKLRKQLFSELRKKGNFLNYNKVPKPVRKSIKVPVTVSLPCPSCLGQYSAKLLWRHKKTCSKKPVRTRQADGQNMLLSHVTRDPELLDKVFPRLRADSISLVAKKDDLICSFGSRYLKTHRDAHFVNVASRKMRELAKLLIEIRELNPALTTLFSVLKPENYDLIIQSVKKVANHDAEKDFFKSPTYALNIGTSIKQCCDIALMHILKKKNTDRNDILITAGSQADVNTLKDLIVANWKFDISSQAGNDLNIQSWNKVTLIPLASDIKNLKEYLIRKGNEAADDLAKNPQSQAYKLLLETIYCRVILLNRRRPGELQRLLLHTYETSSTPSENGSYEEFCEAVTPTETILLKKFKRVVIRGKRGRGVPVLFSTDVQEHITVLLKHRKSIMKSNNNYLFGNPNTSEPICGYKILQKFAKLSGAKNPSAISSTKLRKHLATLSQIFNMSENDLEQLATFMGHTLGVHRSSYRLPNDVYQTAKISKILMLMETGSLKAYRGKSIEEIDINMDEEIDINDIQHVDEERQVENFEELETIAVDNTTKVEGKCKKIEKTIEKVRWTENQKNIVSNFFKNHIELKKIPKRNECVTLLEKYPSILHNLTWVKVKVFVQNKYSGKLH